MRTRWFSGFAGLGIVAVAVFVRLWVGHTLWVRTGAMVPTVNSHEWVWVMKRAPEVGDVVQVEMDDAPGLYRVVGTEGQTIEISNGRLFVDGRQPDDNVAQTVWIPTEGCASKAVPAVRSSIGSHEFYAVVGGELSASRVPAGTVFLLGDNRQKTGDSRAWGPLPVASISGVATRVILSWDACGSGFRWRRTGNSIE